MEIVEIGLDRLRSNDQNPNEMDERAFNALCESIEEEGFIEPIQVVEFAHDDEGPLYEIVGGHHRAEAMRVLGRETIACLTLDPQKFDRDRRDWNVVKLNVLRGNLNPEKFTRLYERMTETYDAEVLQSLMGFTTEDAFRKLFKEVRRALPPELQAALDGTKDEIKTIDDLSLVLNGLFREFGETLPSNFMVFSWAGKDVLWVRADDALWEIVSSLANDVKKTGDDMTVRLTELLQSSQAAEDENAA